MGTHDIWNPWHGCHKVSAGCRNCYMFQLDAQRGVTTPSTMVHRTQEFDKPLCRDRHGDFKIKAGERIRVNMTSDTFVEEADPWRDEMWSIIRQRCDVIFYILTKRPERIADHLPDDWGDGYENVILNITSENQNMFNRRWPLFEAIPAKHKGMTLAPLLGPVDLTPALESGQIEQVECGGENYANPRPCDVAWVYDIAAQCLNHTTNFCWYESGTDLLWHGRPLRKLPWKTDQSRFAFLAGTNRKHYDIHFRLFDPVYHRELDDDERYHPQYNNSRCLFCAGRMICNGCNRSDHCPKDLRLISADELERLEASKRDEMMRWFHSGEHWIRTKD